MGDTPVTEALALLQLAMSKLEQAEKSIADHNIDLESHKDLREMIEELRESEVMFTKQQIKDLIKSDLDTHVQTPMSEAHPGWLEYNTSMAEQLAIVMGRLDDVERRLNGEDTDTTDLQSAIQAVYDKYAPTLNYLDQAFDEAIANGDMASADIVKNNISEVQKNQHSDIMDVYTEYMNNNQPNPTGVTTE